MKKANGMGLAIFLLVLGAFGLASGISLMGKARQVQSWKTAPGKLVERSLVRATIGGPARGSDQYEAQLRYTYAVDGKEYSGTRMKLVREASSKDRMQAAIDALPATPTVYYDPQQPAESILQPGGMGLAAVALGAGLVSLAIGVVVLLGRKG